MRTSLQANPGRRLLEGDYLRLPSAAVCVIVKNDTEKSQPSTLLVRRRVIQSDPWSGDMAFPGGRSRNEDHDVLETVHREVFEETGVDLNSCTLLGTLDDVVPTVAALRVTPFVAIAPESAKINVDEEEIVDYVWIPVEFFMNLSNLTPHTIERLGKKMEVSSFNYLGRHVIWGMSLRILRDFTSRLV